MAEFVRFNTGNPSVPTYINPEHVVCVEATSGNGHALILLTTGKSIRVVSSAGDAIDQLTSSGMPC